MAWQYFDYIFNCKLSFAMCSWRFQEWLAKASLSLENSGYSSHPVTLLLGAHWDYTGVIILIENHALNRESWNKKESKPNCWHLGKAKTKSLLLCFVLVFQVNIFLPPAVGKGKSSPFLALFWENGGGALSKNGETIADQSGGRYPWEFSSSHYVFRHWSEQTFLHL